MHTANHWVGFLSRGFLFAGITVLALLQNGQAGEVDTDILNLIRDGHISSRHAIEALQVSFTIETVEHKERGPSEMKIEAKWLEDKDRVRVTTQPQFPEGTKIIADRTDTVVANGVEKTVSQFHQSASSAEPQAMIRYAEADSAGWTNPWGRGLFLLDDLPMEWVTERLESKTGIICVESESTDRGLRYRVDIDKGDGAKTRLWFNPSRNFLVEMKEVTYGPANKMFSRHIQKVREFHEISEGIWFPATVEMLVYKREAKADAGEFLWREHVTTFDQVTLNPELVDDQFIVDIPTGAQVADEIAGTSYVWGDGKPATMPVPLKSQPETVASVDPVPNNRLFLSFGSVLVAGFLFVIVSLRKKSTNC